MKLLFKKDWSFKKENSNNENDIKSNQEVVKYMKTISLNNDSKTRNQKEQKLWLKTCTF